MTRITWTPERHEHLRFLLAMKADDNRAAAFFNCSPGAIQQQRVRLRIKRIDRPGFSTPSDYGYQGARP